VLRSCSVILVLVLFSLSAAAAAVQGGSMPVPLPLFPANNWWNTDISSAPLDLNSDDFIDFVNNNNTGDPLNDRRVHPDFGGDDSDGLVFGFPFIVVDGAQPKKTVDFVLFGDQSDGVGVPFYPIPDEAITMNGWVEGGHPGNVDERGDNDRHVLIVDKTNNHLYELYNVWFNGTMWEAGSGAFFDMNTNDRRPEEWTSADAAGLAIVPGLVRFDEYAGPDEIRHAFRVTVRATNGFVYPASHEAGSTSGALPMGARLRLKAGKNISGFSPEIQRVFRAFKKYGLIVADNGSDMFVSGTYDTRWDNDIVNSAFHSLKAPDFEVVQLGWAPAVSLVLTMPSALGAGDMASATLTAYDVNSNVVTGYTGTVHFTSTDGAATLPVDYTFTGGDAGTHTFTNGFTLRTAGSHVITVTDTIAPTITGSKGVTVGPPAPTGLVATAVSTGQVNLSWSAATTATQYEVLRSSAPGVFTTVTMTPLTTFNDTTVSPTTAYVYQVRALDAAARPSPLSAPDLATTILFTNDPAAGIVKAVHVSELRQAVNAVRATAGLSASTFTDAALNSTIRIKAVHLQELRTALTAARSALGLSAQSFTDATLVAGTTKVKAAHVQELRTGVK
jgi:hypothetical protein